MTDQKHPITPSSELVEDWIEMAKLTPKRQLRELATIAARWGADQELDACSNFLERELWGIGEDRIGDLLEKLDTERRPTKPLTLKEQALATLTTAHGDDPPLVATWITPSELAIIRRALESLPE